MLPQEDKERKALPIFDGVLMYFPDAIAEVARVSKVGNDQHNPGEPLHWARNKSTDQDNTAIRHLMDAGMGNEIDTDGTWHRAKAAWRILAGLQLAIEAKRFLDASAPTRDPQAGRMLPVQNLKNLMNHALDAAHDEDARKAYATEKPIMGGRDAGRGILR
jgi:hypothetical protein